MKTLARFVSVTMAICGLVSIERLESVRSCEHHGHMGSHHSLAVSLGGLL